MNQRVRQILILVGSIVLSAVVVWLGYRYQHQIQQLGSLGLVGLFIVSVVGNATVFIPVPVFVVACAAAPAYGWLASGIVNGVGATIGETTGWLAGYGGSAIIPQGKWYGQLTHFMEKRGMLGIFLLALIPNPIFDVAGAISGALKMPLWKFFLAAGAGKVIRYTIGAYACGMPWVMEMFKPR